MPRYRIFPAIGLARVGQDPDFFLGPEIPGQGPRELDGSPVQRFKNPDKKRVRRQGARFHLFQSDDDGATWVPAELPDGATVTWTVALQNRKAAVKRPAEPPIAPVRPQLDPALAGLLIDAGQASVTGADAAPVVLHGPYATTGADGSAFNADVELGRILTDAEGRLIVLAGPGVSAAPAGTPIGGSYYRNPKWYDDVADGPVTAVVQLQDGSAQAAEGGAWVISGPPDYAPEIGGAVTLWDVIRQVGIDQLGAPAPAGPPSYDLDIRPLVERVRRLKWVHAAGDWSDARLDSPALRSRAAADKPLREGVRGVVMKTQQILEGHTSGQGPPFRLRKHQTDALQAWVDGAFDDAGAAWPAEPTAEGLTRAALEGAVGQGFCPGIEAGILVLDPTIYAAPFDFRINHGQLQPGDMTALMAQPWQADFVKCNSEWWPTQRPDLAPQGPDLADAEDWIRGATSHKQLVERHQRLGFIVRSGDDEVFVEAERDPTLPG